MTNITETPFADLDDEGRLLSPVFKGTLGKPGRFGFRGEIALKFQRAMADEKRPPAISTFRSAIRSSMPVRIFGCCHWMRRPYITNC